MIHQCTITIDTYSKALSYEVAQEDFCIELMKRGMRKEAEYILRNNCVTGKRYFIGNAEFTVYKIERENIYVLHLKVTYF